MVSGSCTLTQPASKFVFGGGCTGAWTTGAAGSRAFLVREDILRSKDFFSALGDLLRDLFFSFSCFFSCRFSLLFSLSRPKILFGLSAVEIGDTGEADLGEASGLIGKGNRFSTSMLSLCNSADAFSRNDVFSLMEEMLPLRLAPLKIDDISRLRLLDAIGVVTSRSWMDGCTLGGAVTTGDALTAFFGFFWFVGFIAIMLAIG